MITSDFSCKHTWYCHIIQHTVVPNIMPSVFFISFMNTKINTKRYVKFLQLNWIKTTKCKILKTKAKSLVLTKAVKPRRCKADHPRPPIFQNSLKPPGSRRVNKTHEACFKSIFYVDIDKCVHQRKSSHNSLCRWYNGDTIKYFGVGVLRTSYIWTITFVLLGFLFFF